MKLWKALCVKVKSKIMYCKLEHSIKRKKSNIIYFTEKNGRGIGKTYNLMKLSGKYRIPVIVPLLSQKERCEKYYYKLNPMVYTTKQFLLRFVPGSMVLVDERQLISENEKEKLKRYIQIGVETKK